MDNAHNELGNLIRKLRLERGISASTLGEAINLSTPYIYDIEKGKSYPRMQTLTALADFFGVSVDYLLGRKSENSDFKKADENLKNIIPSPGQGGLYILPVVPREFLTLLERLEDASGNALHKMAVEYITWPWAKIIDITKTAPEQPPYAIYANETDKLESYNIHAGDKIVVVPCDKQEQGALSLVWYYGLPTVWLVYDLGSEGMLLQNDVTEVLLTSEQIKASGYKIIGQVAGIVCDRPALRPLIRQK